MSLANIDPSVLAKKAGPDSLAYDQAIQGNIAANDIPSLAANTGVAPQDISMDTGQPQLSANSYSPEAINDFNTLVGNTNELTSAPIETNTESTVLEDNVINKWSKETGLPTTMYGLYQGGTGAAIYGAGQTFSSGIDLLSSAQKPLQYGLAGAVQSVGEAFGSEEIAQSAQDYQDFIYSDDLMSATEAISTDMYDENAVNFPNSYTAGQIAGTVIQFQNLAKVGQSVLPTMGLTAKKIATGVLAGTGTAALGHGSEFDKASKGQANYKDVIYSTARSALTNSVFASVGVAGEIIMPSKYLATAVDPIVGFYMDSAIDHIANGEAKYNIFSSEDWTKDKMIGAILGSSMTFVQNGNRYKVERAIQKESLKKLGNAISMSSHKPGSFKVGTTKSNEIDGMTEKIDVMDSHFKNLMAQNDNRAVRINNDNVEEVIDLVLAEANLTRADLDTYSKKINDSDTYYKKRYDSAKTYEESLNVFTSYADEATQKGRDRAGVLKKVGDRVGKEAEKVAQKEADKAVKETEARQSVVEEPERAVEPTTAQPKQKSKDDLINEKLESIKESNKKYDDIVKKIKPEDENITSSKTQGDDGKFKSPNIKDDLTNLKGKPKAAESEDPKSFIKKTFKKQGLENIKKKAIEDGTYNKSLEKAIKDRETEVISSFNKDIDGSHSVKYVMSKLRQAETFGWDDYKDSLLAKSSNRITEIAQKRRNEPNYAPNFVDELEEFLLKSKGTRDYDFVLKSLDEELDYKGDSKLADMLENHYKNVDKIPEAEEADWGDTKKFKKHYPKKPKEKKETVWVDRPDGKQETISPDGFKIIAPKSVDPLPRGVKSKPQTLNLSKYEKLGDSKNSKFIKIDEQDGVTYVRQADGDKKIFSLKPGDKQMELEEVTDLKLRGKLAQIQKREFASDADTKDRVKSLKDLIKNFGSDAEEKATLKVDEDEQAEFLKGEGLTTFTAGTKTKAEIDETKTLGQIEQEKIDEKITDRSLLLDSFLEDVYHKNPETNSLSFLLDEMKGNVKGPDGKDTGIPINSPFQTYAELKEWKSFLSDEDFTTMSKDILSGNYNDERLAVSVDPDGKKVFRYVSDESVAAGVKDVNDNFDEIAGFFRTTLKDLNKEDDFGGSRPVEADFERTDNAALDKYFERSDEGFHEGYSTFGKEQTDDVVSNLKESSNVIDAVKRFLKSSDFINAVADKTGIKGILKAIEKFIRKTSVPKNMRKQSLSYYDTYLGIKNKRDYLSGKFGDNAINSLLTKMEAGEDVSGYALIDEGLKSVFKDVDLDRKLVSSYMETYNRLGGRGPLIVAAREQNPNIKNAEKDFPSEYDIDNGKIIYMAKDDFKNGFSPNATLSHELGHKIFEEAMPVELKSLVFNKLISKKNLLHEFDKMDDNADVDKILGNYYRDFSTNLNEGKTIVSDKVKDLSNRLKTEDNPAVRDEILGELHDANKLLTSDVTFMSEVGAEMMAHSLNKGNVSTETYKAANALYKDLTGVQKHFTDISKSETDKGLAKHQESRKNVFEDTESLMGDFYKTLMKGEGFVKGLDDTKDVDPASLTIADSRIIGNLLYQSNKAEDFYKREAPELARTSKIEKLDVMRSPDQVDNDIDFNDAENRGRDFLKTKSQAMFGVYEDVLKKINPKSITPSIHRGLMKAFTGIDNLTNIQAKDFEAFYTKNKDIVDGALKKANILKGTTNKVNGDNNEFSKASENLEADAGSKYRGVKNSLYYQAVNDKVYMLDLMKDIGKTLGEDNAAYMKMQDHIEGIRKGDYANGYAERFLGNVNNLVRKVGLTSKEIDDYQNYVNNSITPGTETKRKYDIMTRELISLRDQVSDYAIKNKGTSNRDNLEVEFNTFPQFISDNVRKIMHVNINQRKKEFSEIMNSLVSTPEGRRMAKENNIKFEEMTFPEYNRAAEAGDKDVLTYYDDDGEAHYYRSNEELLRYHNDSTKKHEKQNAGAKIVDTLNSAFYTSVLTLNGAFAVKNLLKDYHSTVRKSEKSAFKNYKKYGTEYFKNIVKAYKDIRGDQSQTYVELTDEGLLSSVGTSHGILTPTQVEKRLKKRATDRFENRSRALSFPSRGLEFLEDALTATERAGKYTEYDYLKELEGEDFAITKDRANNIRNLGNPNPFERGKQSSKLGSVLSFYNSIIRGFAEEGNYLKRIYDKNNKSKVETSKEVLMNNLFVALPSVVYALADNGLFGDEAEEVFNKSTIENLASGKKTPIAGIFNQSGDVVGAVNSSLFIMDEQQQLASMAMLTAYKSVSNKLKKGLGDNFKGSNVTSEDAAALIGMAVPNASPTVELIMSLSTLARGGSYSGKFNEAIIHPNFDAEHNIGNAVKYNLNNFGLGVFYNKKDWASGIEGNTSDAAEILDLSTGYFTNKIPYVNRALSTVGKSSRFNPKQVQNYNETRQKALKKLGR